MSKIFACFFPFLLKPKEDIKNTAFIRESSNSSICELSYHHVESVAKKVLQKRVEKLEKEREALVDMMIDQHETYKKSIIIIQGAPVIRYQKNEKVTPNYYYKKIERRFKKHNRAMFEESFTENTYDYIAF